DQLRQGRAGADHARVPRRGAGPLPGRPDRRRVSEAPLELAERALGHADGEMQVTVTQERSLLARFARSAPTQATEIDDLTVHVLVVRDGHLGAAATNLISDDALRETARRAQTAARAAAQAADAPGEHPGLPAPAHDHPS